jgi:hypothetical protein
MAEPIQLAFLFILPLAFFLAGAYLLNKGRGYRYQAEQINHARSCDAVPGGLAVLSGKASCSDVLQSFEDQSKCVYSYLELEYFDMARKKWLPRRAFERKAPFFLQCSDKRFLVNPLGAEFDAKETVYQEMKKRPPRGKGVSGEVAEFLYEYRGFHPVVAASRHAESYDTAFDAEPFDEKIYDSLEDDPQVRGILLQYKEYRKRATIRTIRESDDLVVIGDAVPQGDSMSIQQGGSRFIISTMGIEKITRQISGKAAVSMFLGAVAVIISAAMVFTILFS